MTWAQRLKRVFKASASSTPSPDSFYLLHDALSPGTEVPCHYNPAELAAAVLSPGPRFGQRQWIVSAVFCLAGVAAFGTGLYQKLFR